MNNSPRTFTVAELVRLLGLRGPGRSSAEDGKSASNQDEYETVSEADFLRSCRDGDRTQHLVRLAGYLIGEGLSPVAAIKALLAWNSINEPPLPDQKILTTVASIARTHARNHPVAESLDTPLFDLNAASVQRFIGKPVPERDWVLENCLPLGKVGLVVAPGGTGKSQLMLQLAYAVAGGDDSYSPWKPGPVGQVLLIGAEDEEDEYHRRFERLMRASASSSDAAEVLKNITENLFIVSRVGQNNLMTRDAGGEVVPTDLVERLAKTVKPLKNLRLIILDPVSRFRGGEENSAEDTTRFVEAAEALVKLTGAAVLLVHHTNKASYQGSDQSQGASRGSSALTDGVRLQINLGTPAPNELKLLNGLLPVRWTPT
ncbi:MAG: AAA family ATPase [Casimicrobiaceae bacterium]